MCAIFVSFSLSKKEFEKEFEFLLNYSFFFINFQNILRVFDFVKSTKFAKKKIAVNVCVKVTNKSVCILFSSRFSGSLIVEMSQ